MSFTPLLIQQAKSSRQRLGRSIFLFPFVICHMSFAGMRRSTNENENGFVTVDGELKTGPLRLLHGAVCL
jgi:hypothetical protein